MNKDFITKTQRREVLLGDYKKAMTVCADYACCADDGFEVLMLVPVEQQFRPRAGDVRIESNKAMMHLVFAVMHVSGRIVSKENIHWRKECHEFLSFGLLEHVIALWFVFPRTAEAAEFDTAKCERFHVHVTDRSAKQRTRVMIAFNCKNLTTTTPARYFQNGFIGQVTEGNKKIGWAIWNLTLHRLVIRDDEEIHCRGMILKVCRKSEPK
jgi:hypothetical protein